MIANKLANLDGFVIRKYCYNLGSVKIPLLINGIEEFILNDTLGQEKRYYPEASTPLTFTVKQDIAPQLNSGQYIRIYTQIDGGVSYDNLYKSIPKGTKIGGKYNKDCYFQVSLENTGQLQPATPFNLTVENNTILNPTMLMYSQYYGEVFDSSNGTVLQTKHWMNWDYTYPYYSIDMTNESRGIKFELICLDNNQSKGTGWAYSGGNYQGNNWIGQMYSGYGRNYKLVISYI